MPITLYLLYQAMPNRPAFSFGLAASFLLPGLVLALYLKGINTHLISAGILLLNLIAGSETAEEQAHELAVQELFKCGFLKRDEHNPELIHVTDYAEKALYTDMHVILHNAEEIEEEEVFQ